MLSFLLTATEWGGGNQNELTFNMLNVNFCDTHAHIFCTHIQIEMGLHAETQGEWGTCFSNMQICWLLLQKAWRDKGNQWPMVAHIKALRWQNHNESEAHLSTTRFHMQVATRSLIGQAIFLSVPITGLRAHSGEITRTSRQSINPQSAQVVIQHMLGKNTGSSPCLPYKQTKTSKYCHLSFI